MSVITRLVCIGWYLNLVKSQLLEFDHINEFLILNEDLKTKNSASIYIQLQLLLI